MYQLTPSGNFSYIPTTMASQGKIISVVALEKQNIGRQQSFGGSQQQQQQQYENFWSRFHNARASLDLPPLRATERSSLVITQTASVLDTSETETSEEDNSNDNEYTDVECPMDESFESNKTVDTCLDSDEEDHDEDIFTKSLAIENLNLRNFLMVGDRKKKISDISEIIAFNNHQAQFVSQVEYQMQICKSEV